MGKIVEYIHHGARVYVDEDLKGKHREHCLCLKCQRFKPSENNNCTTAQKLYAVCIEENLTTPVYECEKFLLKEEQKCQ